MAPEEAADRSWWWESLAPGDDPPRAWSELDEPVQWPEPIEFDGPERPLTEVVLAAFDDEAGADPLADLLPPSRPAPAAEDVQGADAPLTDEAWSPELWPEDEPVGGGVLATGATAVPGPYAAPAPRSSPKGWHGALAGRATKTILVGVLGVAGIALFGVTMVARSGSDLTKSAQLRPDGAEIAGEGDVEPLPLTTTTPPTVPTTVDPAAPVGVEEPVTDATPEAATSASTTPVTRAPATTVPRSSTPSGRTSPVQPAAQSSSQAAPSAPAPAAEPEPVITTAPPVSSTMPATAATTPWPTITLPSIPPIPTFPTAPRRNLPAGSGR